MTNKRNVQLVVSLDDLRTIFAEWRDEQKEKEQQTIKEKENEGYLTTVEVCKMLDVTKPTLWRWAQVKYLVPVKVGRKNYYKVADIEALRKG